MNRVDSAQSTCSLGWPADQGPAARGGSYAPRADLDPSACGHGFVVATLGPVNVGVLAFVGAPNTAKQATDLSSRCPVGRGVDNRTETWARGLKCGRSYFGTQCLVSDELVQRVATVPAANIGDVQHRFGIVAGLRALWAGAQLAWRAFHRLDAARVTICSSTRYSMPPNLEYR